MLWCPECGGWGAPDECRKCRGKGTITAAQIEPGMAPCHRCQTEGLVWIKGMIEPCPKCDGKQYVPITAWYKIKESISGYFLFTQPWRWMLLWLVDYLPGDWGERLANRLYPIGETEIYFEGEVNR